MGKRCVETGWVDPRVIDVFTVVEIVLKNLLKGNLIRAFWAAEGLKLQTRGIGRGRLKGSSNPGFCPESLSY